MNLFLSNLSFKQFKPLLLLIAALFILHGCKDDKNPDLPGNTPDNFEGNFKDFFLFAESEGFSSASFTLAILAPDNTVITRSGLHKRENGKSHFSMTTGLKDGEYRLLYLEYPIKPEEATESKANPIRNIRQFGLGTSLSVAGNEASIISSFDERVGLTGRGSKNDPYIISSYDHLITLALKVNSDLTNSIFTENTYISQIVDIDMDDACFFVDHRYGWEPIGSNVNLPFRGVYQGKKLTNMWSLRDKSAAVGLFGYIHKSQIDGLTIENGEFAGNFAVGTVAGAVVTEGTTRDNSSISNCRAVRCSVEGSTGSLAIGGIVGVADMHSRIMLYNCQNEDSSVSGDYNVGGIIGASSAYSLSSINNCRNSGRITSGFSGAGGIVGTADTIYATSCHNTAEINGGTRYSASDSKNAAVGTGGIAGGTGVAFATGCDNSGLIKGHEGVGGIIGSSRVAGNASQAFIFNDAAFRYCSNSGYVRGSAAVGGICGEGQFGCFGVLNTGDIEGSDYIGGIVGNTSIAVAHNAINKGKVTGKDYVAGIVAKTTFGSIALDDNYGEINGSGSHSAGVLALAGNNTIVHYCGNHAPVVNTSGKHVGGIAGEIGDPREWTGWNTAECIVGAAEIVMSILGPVISVAEHAAEGIHALAIILKYGEFSFDMLLHATDAVLISYGFKEMASGESIEEVQTEIKAETMELANDINAKMASIRNGIENYHLSGIATSPLCQTRGESENDHVEWYSQEGNDEIFNENINKAREEKMEEEEKVKENSEIIHQTIGAVCLIAGTAAAIGATVASGGLATTFIATGMMVGFVGGVNAIQKTCSEFECNAVVVSQCVNSGEIRGSGNAAAIVGSLQDFAEVRDCLNVGNGTGKEHAFVSHYGKHAAVYNTMNAGTGWAGSDPGYNDYGSAVSRKDGAGTDSFPFEHPVSGLMYADGKALNDWETIKSFFPTWDISENLGSRWTATKQVGNEIYYPVPSFSEMRAK